MSQPDDRPRREVSERKRAANRANAKKSTGPRSPEGKQRVSLNALTHGLTTGTAVLPFENRDHFEKFATALRADLRPVGFLQTLLSERIVDLAWKLRRASRAQTDLASRLVDEDLHQHKIVVERGAYVGPYTPLTGSGIVADAVENGEGAVPSAGFLRLDLYADRLQRAMLGAVMRLRREQERAARAGQTAPPADVEVELGEDVFEDALMNSKATAGEAPEGEPLDLRVFIRDPYDGKSHQPGEPVNHPNSQNKATEGGGEVDADSPAAGDSTAGEGEAPVGAPAVQSVAPEEPRRPPADAPTAGVRSAAGHRHGDPGPWRELPPWHPIRPGVN
jgi:hypothetical protein